MKTKKLLISEMPEQERPREKCALLGPEKLRMGSCLLWFYVRAPRNQSALALADEILGGGGLEKLYHLIRKRPAGDSRNRQGKVFSASGDRRAFHTAFEA